MLPIRSSKEPPSRVDAGLFHQLAERVHDVGGGRLAAVPVIPFRFRQELLRVLRLRGVVAFARDERARGSRWCTSSCIRRSNPASARQVLHRAEACSPSRDSLPSAAGRCRRCRGCAPRSRPATTSTGSPPRPRPSGSPTDRTTSRTSGTDRTCLISVMILMVLSISVLRHVAFVAVFDVAARLHAIATSITPTVGLILQRGLALEVGAEQIGPTGDRPPTRSGRMPSVSALVIVGMPFRNSVGVPRTSCRSHGGIQHV
jgi:hypothetical protein